MIYIFQGGKATERSVTAWTATPEFLWGAELLVLHPEHFLAQVSIVMFKLFMPLTFNW